MSMNLVVKGKFIDISDIDRITKSPQGKARINDKDEVRYYIHSTHVISLRKTALYIVDLASLPRALGLLKMKNGIMFQFRKAK